MQKIYWDIQNHELLKSSASGQAFQRMDWILRDLLSTTLYTMVPNDSTGSYDLEDVAAGSEIRFALKASDARGGGNLVLSVTWTNTATGTYTATIDLNTAELIADMGEEVYQDYVGEFVIVDAAENQSDSTQITVRITADVYRGTEPAPTASIERAWQDYQNANGAWCVRLVNQSGETLASFAPAGEEP